ncbi:MAG: hypothetical protein ABH833_02705 [Parcubacteria group bacterium]
MARGLYILANIVLNTQPRSYGAITRTKRLSQMVEEMKYLLEDTEGDTEEETKEEETSTDDKEEEAE